jgi:hypothetical protein
VSEPSEHLVILRARVDRHFADAVARSPGSFACAPGCSHCCERFSVFEVEAAPIRAALEEIGRRDPGLRERLREQGRDASSRACALLVDGRCSVYAQRPLICRSHGLPVAVPDTDDPARLRVDHCPLNFVDGQIPRPSILVLEALNQPLAMVSQLQAPGAPRLALADLAAGPPPDKNHRGA